MSRVQHQNIEPLTFNYNGPSLAHWNNQSSLVNVILIIQKEFEKNPPIPIMQSANAVIQPAQKQGHVPEKLTIVKPQLTELIKQVQGMSTEQLANVKESQSLLLDLIFAEKEMGIVDELI